MSDAEHHALASARVAASVLNTVAAAVATLLSLNSGVAYRNLDARDIQTRMIADGSALKPATARVARRKAGIVTNNFEAAPRREFAQQFHSRRQKWAVRPARSGARWE